MYRVYKTTNYELIKDKIIFTYRIREHYRGKGVSHMKRIMIMGFAHVNLGSLLYVTLFKSLPL